MEALPDSMAIPQVLDLLTTVTIVTAVTLYRQFASGIAHITVRRVASQHGPRPQYHYWWETRVMTGGQAWDNAASQACATAEDAYRAAVQAVQAAQRRPGGEATAGVQ